MSRAFLIGAGATRAQYPDAPLSDNFFKKLEKKNVELFIALRDTIQYHLGKDLKESNVEDVMQKLYHLDLDQGVINKYLADLYSAIYELLAIPTQSNTEYIRKYLSGEIIRPQTLLKTLLIDSRLNENDFFMTLNYDLYLDIEVISTKEMINYGIDHSFMGALQDIPLSQEPHFSVYHLHGSLNWEFEKENKVNINLGAISPRHFRSEPSLCLVPPGNKELNPVLKSIWNIAERRLLQETDELIIIGCSLNQADTELIKLIKEFIEKKDLDKRIIVKVIDYSSEDKINNNFLDILDDRFAGYTCGFCLNPPKNKRYLGGAFEFIFKEQN